MGISGPLKQYPLIGVMAATNLKQLLLEPWSGRAPALFDSQAEIARSIAGRKGSRYENRTASLTAFLNQILNQGRSCPPELRAELIAVTIEEAKTKWSADSMAPTTQEVEAILGSALTSDGLSHEVTEIFLRQVRAREVVIVNPMTIEGRGHPRAGEFQKALVAGILEEINPVRYVFLLDESDPGGISRHIEQTGLGLQAELKKRPNAPSAEEKFKELSKSKIIQILGIPKELCIIPVVAFDPRSLGDADVYVWDWMFAADGSSIDNVAKLSQLIKNKWITDFYYSEKIRKIIGEATNAT